MKPEHFIREFGVDKAREEFEKKLKCQDLLSELTFCEKTSSYEGDILPTNLATINGAYWAWVKRQAEMDEQQAKVEELEGKLKQAYEDVDTFAEAHERECGFKAQLAKDKAELQKRVDKALELMQKPLIVGEPAKYVCARFKEIEQALKGECRHESDGTNRLSLPPKTKCKKCGKFYSANVLKGEGQ
ncbi:TPA: hypothetical protein RP468_002706 [Acinetobacter baumannii]|nr:hypothetical protein [Acinetobacter baumannii]